MTEEIIKAGDDERANDVLTEIKRIRGNLHEGLFDLAELLAESRKNGFHLNWGFARFGDWVEKGSGLDMSERTAYYLMKIVESGKQLGIPREQLREAKMSKLKEIFSLSAEEHGDEMRKLVGTTDQYTLQELRAKVEQIKVGGGLEPFVYLTVKIPKSVKENVVNGAFDLVRQQYGDVRDPVTGDIIDVNEGKCLEYVCIAYLQDLNNQGEQHDSERV